MTIFDEVVEACGLAAFLAQDVVCRACRAAGIEPAALTRENLPALAPSLRKSLSLFVTRSQLERSMEAISALSRTPVRGMKKGG